MTQEEEHMKNPCKYCNASHENNIERIIRCCTCAFQVGKMPTKYLPVKQKRTFK